MDTGPNEETKCWTCERWQPKKSGAMAKQRLAVCELGPRWQFMSPLHVCERHDPMKDRSALAKREAWLSRELQAKEKS